MNKVLVVNSQEQVRILQKAKHDVIGDDVLLSAWSIAILTGADEAQHINKYVTSSL